MLKARDRANSERHEEMTHCPCVSIIYWDGRSIPNTSTRGRNLFVVINGFCSILTEVEPLSLGEPPICPLRHPLRICELAEGEVLYLTEFGGALPPSFVGATGIDQRDRFT